MDAVEVRKEYRDRQFPSLVQWLPVWDVVPLIGGQLSMAGGNTLVVWTNMIYDGDDHAATWK